MGLIKGKRVVIRRLTLEDVFGMREWGKHTNPLYFDYNFPSLKDEEVVDWFNTKTQSKNKECFGVLNEEKRIIGYLTIKGIKQFRKTSTLGIVFDPNYINNGYGTETIMLFLEYYFHDLKMKTLYLDVAKFNLRAMNCYKKCGFTKIGESMEQFQAQILNHQTSSFKRDKEHFYFDYKKQQLYSYFYKMKISRNKYVKKKLHIL